MFPLLAFFLTTFVAIAIAIVLIPVAVALVALSIAGAIRWYRRWLLAE